MLAAALLSLAISAADPAAAAPPPDDPVTVLDEIVVQGRPLREAIEHFVDEVVTPPVGRGPARWTTPVCVSVVNMQRESAQALADQMSAVALRVGVEVGEPGCRPNVVVIATDDGPTLAKGMVQRMPRAFRPAYAGASRSAYALERFQDTAAPVRWWHVSMPMMRDFDVPAVRLPGELPPNIPGEGLLRSPVRNDLTRAFIIVDLDEAEGLDTRQLGDYLGMVALAQIDPEAQTAGYQTILNLFDEGLGQPGLTEWDMSYLDALYGAELNRRAAGHQSGEIASQMFRDRREGQEGGSE